MDEDAYCAQDPRPDVCPTPQIEFIEVVTDTVVDAWNKITNWFR